MVLHKSGPTLDVLIHGPATSFDTIQYRVTNVNLAGLQRQLYETLGRCLGQAEGQLLLAGIPLDKEQIASFLVPLARIGQLVFRQLFLGAPAAADQDRLRKIFAQPRLLNILGESDAFPWEFVYTAEGDVDETTVRGGAFLGFAHEIQRFHGPNPEPPHVLATAPQVLAVICPIVDKHAREHGTWHRRSYWLRQHGRPITTLEEFLQGIIGFQKDVLYFVGHAEPGADESDTKIGLNQRWATLAQIRQHCMMHRSLSPLRPRLSLGLLSLCEGVPWGNLESPSLYNYLKGQVGPSFCCVTTSGAIPSPFAARFGHELLHRVFSAHHRHHLGRALLLARKALLRRGHPLGLLYLLLGNLDTRCSLQTG